MIEILNIMYNGLVNSIFGDYQLAILIVLFLLSIVLFNSNLTSGLVLIILIPIVYVFKDQVQYLWVILIIILGFFFADALEKLTKQQY